MRDLLPYAVGLLGVSQLFQGWLISKLEGRPDRPARHQGPEIIVTTNTDTQTFIDTVLAPRIAAGLKAATDAATAAVMAGQQGAIDAAVAAAQVANDALIAEMKSDHADDLAALQAKLDALIPPAG